VSDPVPSWWPRCGASKGKNKLCMQALFKVATPDEAVGDYVSCPKHGLRGAIDLKEWRTVPRQLLPRSPL